MSNVFHIPFYVTATEHTMMPVGSDGARVSCYVGELNLELAIKKAISKLKNDGLSTKRILDPVERMDSSHWAFHVAKIWPEQAYGLCTQEEFEDSIERGVVIYGPLTVYSQQSV